MRPDEDTSIDTEESADLKIIPATEVPPPESGPSPKAKTKKVKDKKINISSIFRVCMKCGTRTRWNVTRAVQRGNNVNMDIECSGPCGTKIEETLPLEEAEPYIKGGN